MVGHRLGEFSPTRTFRGHGHIVKTAPNQNLKRYPITIASTQKNIPVLILRKLQLITNSVKQLDSQVLSNKTDSNFIIKNQAKNGLK